jgi:hypothetical protein
VGAREKQIRGSGGSFEPPEHLPTHLRTVYMAFRPLEPPGWLRGPAYHRWVRFCWPDTAAATGHAPVGWACTRSNDGPGPPGASLSLSLY